ncbi:hypothetical protein V9T40_001845 [Parthenolecanium corni]|uniref:Inositol-pentakisphosphate 2-kinase n=1 Tax=Parthenolecanium corni TaxID=536013 RepID=A0AAN9TTF7_9HEMI
MDSPVQISRELSKIDLNQLKLVLKGVNLMDLHLQYRGEGNENLVFSLADIKYVLRLRKSAAAVRLETENENLKLSFLYHYFIVRTFFANIFSLVPIIVEIPMEEINWLNEFFLKQRPDFRKEKQLFYNVAEVYPDLAFLPLFRNVDDHKCAEFLSMTPHIDFLKTHLSDEYIRHRNFVFSLFTNPAFRDQQVALKNPSNLDTLCVEIKPKQGWTAEADRLSGICPFCLNQYKKLSSQTVDSKSGYCPLDLFSGDSERMLRALKELIKCPQNNFRIFKDGNLVYSENGTSDLNSILCAWFDDEDVEKSINNFCYLLTKILTHEIPSGNESITFVCDPLEKSDRNLSTRINVELIEQILTMLETRCRQETSCLPDNSILGLILRLQKIDSAGLDAVRNFHAHHASEYDSDYGYVYNIISRIESRRPSKIINLNVLEAYLLSTAAKDLSILMSFRRTAGNEISSNIVVQDHSERQYEAYVSVVDVGPKPISCLKKHKKRNENVINSFVAYHCASSAKENKIC